MIPCRVLSTRTHIVRVQPTKKTMEPNQLDPESIGAGPLNFPPAPILSPRLHKDRQCFHWSRVILSPDSINPPPRSGAASVVVQGKLYMFGVSSLHNCFLCFRDISTYSCFFIRATEAGQDD